jgi:hypothetical protein
MESVSVCIMRHALDIGLLVSWLGYEGTSEIQSTYDFDTSPRPPCSMLKLEDNDERLDVAELAPVVPNGVGNAWTRVDGDDIDF